MATNLEHYLGTPEDAANVICRLKYPRIGQNHLPDDFEKAWLDWYVAKTEQTSVADMPSILDCMIEFLKDEYHGK